MARAVFGFDGTGSQEWSQVDLRRSYVHKIVNQAIADHRFYYLGSDDAGQNTETVVYKALGRASGVIAQNGVTEIIVAGYSRGGLMSVAFADLLKQKHPTVTIPVMVLFDPVERNLPIKGAQGTTITNNAKFVIRVFRDPSYGSRLYMNNCALWNESGPNIISAKFPVSHAGAGGLPWDAAFFENGDVWEAIASGQAGQAQNKLGAKLGATYRGKSRQMIYETRCTLDEAADRKGAYQVGYWVWHYLRARGAVEQDANFERNLPILNDMIYTNARII